ncbi:MAG: carboxypeptidase regulatory-like domain-containing protein, partial [Acidobacteriales bacterium]|nr:carboxypeptidase regulatory-like domain-containing protein [Terriglobales bacterium]
MDPARRLAARAVCAVLWAATAFVPVCAAQSANVGGVVHDAAGRPQAGATVEIFSLASSALTAVQTVITDQRGHYSLRNLLPGEYLLRVSAPAFLSSEAENLRLRADSHAVVDLTLNTIFRAEQMLPAKRAVSGSDDDWKWTLRSSANRPVLRVMDPDPTSRETRSDDAGLSAK